MKVIENLPQGGPQTVVIRDVLQVVHDQSLCRIKPATQLFRSEWFAAGKIRDRVFAMCAQIPADGLQQMGLAGTGRAVNIQQIFRITRVGNTAGELQRPGIAVTDNEAVKGEDRYNRKFEELLHGQNNFPWGGSGAIRWKC